MKYLLATLAICSVAASADVTDDSIAGMQSVLQSDFIKKYVSDRPLAFLGIQDQYTMTLDVARYYRLTFGGSYVSCFAIVSVQGFQGPGEVRIESRGDCDEKLKAEQVIKERLKTECQLRTPPPLTKETDLEEYSREAKEAYDARIKCVEDVVEEENNRGTGRA